MNSIEKQAIQELFTKITHSIDPLYIRGFLFEKGVVNKELMEKMFDIKSATLRAEEFVLAVETSCPFPLFLEALNLDRGYSFLVQELEAKVDEIKNRDLSESDDCYNECTISATEAVPGPLRRVNIHTRRHAKMVKYRHQLKRFNLEGKTEEFYRLKNYMLQLWKSFKQRADVNISKQQEYADLYFYSLDSEIEFRRVRYDTTLMGDRVFKHMFKVIPFTTNPKLSSMMYFARRASAMHMAGKSAEDYLIFLRFAKEHGELLTPCRETGIVLIIEFNLLCHVYEKNPNQTLRDELLRLSRMAIAHFDKESDTDVHVDFRRILLLKSSFIYLGITLFGKYLQGVDVTDVDLKTAKSCLREVEKPHLWSRIETRWLMIYYMALSRLHYIEGRYDMAYKDAVKAHELSMQGGFLKELQSVEATMEELVKTKDVVNLSEEDNIFAEFEKDYHSDGSIDMQVIKTEICNNNLKNENHNNNKLKKAFLYTIIIILLSAMVILMLGVGSEPHEL